MISAEEARSIFYNSCQVWVEQHPNIMNTIYDQVDRYSKKGLRDMKIPYTFPSDSGEINFLVNHLSSLHYEVSIIDKTLVGKGRIEFTLQISW